MEFGRDRVFCGSQNTIGQHQIHTETNTVHSSYIRWRFEQSVCDYFQSSHLFCAIVAVVGVGGNSLGSIFAILRSRTLRMSDLEDIGA